MKLAAKELRLSEPTEDDLKKIKRRPIYIICDNVLDTYNIGSIFRLADAVAASCVYLCAGSETPPNSRIAKASVGTDKWVKWEYFKTAEESIRNLRKKFSTLRDNSGQARSNSKISDVIASEAKQSKQGRDCHDPQGGSRNDKGGVRIVAIEQGKGSVDFREADYRLPIAFIVGHETDGVSKEALALCDEILEIPMFGVNRSLNVMVSLAIVLFRAI